MNQPYATLTHASALHEMFGVQLYKNNARALLSHILSILNLDWLQNAHSVRGVYEMLIYAAYNGHIRCCKTKLGSSYPSPVLLLPTLLHFQRICLQSVMLHTFTCLLIHFIPKITPKFTMETNIVICFDFDYGGRGL